MVTPLKLWLGTLTVFLLALVPSIVPVGDLASPARASVAATAASDPDGLCTQSVGNTDGVTVTRIGRECVVMFGGIGERSATWSGTNSWTVPSGVTEITYLVVGGGASGTRGVNGKYWGHGGGGGGVRAGTSATLSGVLQVTVGEGGAGASSVSSDGQSGNNGTSSSLGILTAAGGSINKPNGTLGGTSGAPTAFSGGNGGADGSTGCDADNNNCGAGGGGGAGGAGDGLNAGPGLESSITGTARDYGSGGAGRNTNGYGTATTGGGYVVNGNATLPGGGGSDTGSGIGAGADGIVVVRYSLEQPQTVSGFQFSSNRFIDEDSNSDSVTLEWTAATAQTPAVTGYEIKYSTNSDLSSPTTVAVSGSSTTSREITGLTDGATYYFEIYAKNSNNQLSATASEIVSRALSPEDYAFDFNKSDPSGPSWDVASSSSRVIPNGEFTFEAWIKPTSKSTYQSIFFQGSSVSNRLGLWLRNDTFLHVGVPSGSDEIEVGDISGRWSHVAISGNAASPATFDIYLNGFLAGTVAPNGGPNAGDGRLNLGRYTSSLPLPFDGQIDQVKIWSSQLTQTQIQESMHTWDDTGVTGSPTLISHYDFNDNTQSTVLRDMQGSNDLTLSNAATDDFTSLVEKPSRTGYDVYKFARSYLTATGGWTIPGGVTEVDYLIVAGGGGGGGHIGGGGGGGQVRTGSKASLTPGDVVEVTVGQGGLGGKRVYTDADGDGGLGGSSSAFSISASGGAGGSTLDENDASKDQGGPGGASGSGNVGGAGGTYGSAGAVGGGGGGASTNGAAGTSAGSTSPTSGQNGGDGGQGASSTILTGSASFYGGGGGGGVNQAGAYPTARSGGGPGEGGAGGGGNGGPNPVTSTTTNSLTAGLSGTPGSGGGGGGASGNGATSSDRSGGNGGSGLVVFAVVNSFTLTLSSAGSSTTQTLDYGGTPTDPGTTRTGFSLLGWSDDDDSTAEYAADLSDYSMGAANDTIYAVWRSDLLLALDATDRSSFDSVTSSTSITNLGRTGSTNNATIVGDISGDGQVFDFPSSNTSAYIDIDGSLSTNDFQNGFTIDFYATVPSSISPASWDRILDFAVSNGNEFSEYSYNMVVSRLGDSDQLSLHVASGSGGAHSWCNTVGTAFDGTLKRYTISADSSGCTIYIDEVSVSVSNSYALSSTTDFRPVANKSWDNLYVGKSNYLGNAFQRGSLRSLRVMTKVYTPSQIDALYSADLDYTTVSFDSNGGTDPSDLVTTGSIRLPSPGSRTGYTFGGWYEDETYSTSLGMAGALYTPGDTSLHAQWTIDTYTMTYSAGDYGSGSNVTATKTHGSSLTLPDSDTANGYFTRTGYTVSGWSTSSDGSTSDYALGASYTTNAAETLYPVWTAVYFEATGDAFVNSGSSANSSTGSSSALLLKNAVNSTSNSYNRVAYAEFSFDPSLTWSGGILELVVTGNSSGGGSAWNSSYTTFNVNVYGANDASWNESTLTFNSADASTQDWGINTGTWPWTPNDGDFLGTISIPTSASTVGNTYALSTAELDAFLNDDADGAVTLFFVRSDTDSRGNLSFASKEHGTYAGPTLKPSQSGYTYTVAYDINGGTGTLPSPGTFTDGSGTDYTVASPSSVTAPTNKVFISWNTKADGTGTSYSPGASYNTSRSVTLYAIYATATFTVTYAAGDNGSGSSQTATKTSGVNLTLPDSASANSYFSRAGHTVTAWSTNADGSTTDYALGGSYSTNAADTLYPVWTIDTYDIVFASGDDASGSSQTDSKTYNVTFSIPNSATSNTYFSRTGYTITSWSINSDGSSSDYDFGDSYTTNSSLTLYPVWTADTYTVTFNKGSLSGAGGSNVTATKTHDVALTLPNSATANGYFSKTGYTIVGWSVNADGSTTDFSLGGSYTTEAADTLYPVWEANDYTVSYTYNGATGGNSVSSIVYTVDGIQVSLPSPTKTGYTFAGWFSNVGLTTLVGAGGASYTPGDDIRLYAKWTAATFTVVFEYNGATSGNSTTNDQYETGQTAITLPTPTRDGYSFGGWYSDAGLTTSVGDAGDSYTPSLNLTIYAKWTAINRSVTYSTANRTGGSAPTDSASYIIGDTVVVKGNTGLLTRTGYTFAGWTVAADGSGTVLNAGATLTVSTSNITLYPKWTPATFTITYHPNGGAGTLSKTSDSYTTLGTSVTLPTTVSVTKTGYTFAGWALTPTGSAVSSPFTTTADVTLYARWTIKDISYTFAKGVDGAGSSLSAYGFSAFPADDMDPYGTSVTLPSTDQEIDVNGDSVTDHQFGGWSDGTSIFDAGDPYILGDADVSFVAQWIRVYSVRYVLAGGSLYGTDQLTDAECLGSNNTCTDGQTITLNRTPTRAGYNFLGWEDQSGQVKASRVSTAISSSSYIFTAKWDAIDYSVSFDSAGGSISIPLSSANNIGDLITLQSPGTKTGYTFSGWEDSSGVLYAVGTTYRMGASSESFEAQWIPDVYSVTYDWQGGASSTPKVSDSYTVGTGNMSLPTASANGYTRDGYTFSGWSTTPTGSLETAFQPTADDVLYAIWADGNYTLTYDAQGGTIIASSASVARTTSTILPTPTRTNFTLVGWYTAASGGTKIGDAGDTFEPSSSTTLYARWVQDSLYGVDEATLETATTTITADGTVGNDQSASATSGGSSADVVVPGGALPDGTVVNIRYFRDTNRQSSLISGDNTYFFSVLVSWLYGSGTSATVPDTHPSRPIEVTLTNSSIKAGARVYQVIGTQVTDLGVAVADGSVTVELFSDPQLVVAATAPSAPTGVTGTAGDTRAAVSWTAGSSGGSPITGYTVTASPGGATCSTAGTSCTIGSLTNNTAYTFTVRATNALGTSSASQASSGVTPVGANYTVTFNSAGGSAVSDGSFFSGSTVSAPTSPSRSGYSFAGWSTVQGDASTAVTFPYAPGVTSAITLYALWNVAPTTSPGSSEGRGNSAANTPGVTRAPVVIPRRVVGPIAPVTPPTLFRAPVVIVPERGFDPDSGSQARVGGLPATVTKSTPAPGGVSVGVGRVQVGITPTNPQPSGGSATPGPASDISVSQGQSARVTGGGLLPGSQLQVWLPGISGNSPRELARIPVNTDGTFESELTFSSRQSETPVAIGRQIVQVTGFDELGNQTIVDMTITIGQGDPAPEPNRSVNALPDLAPGQSLATSAGVPEVVTIEARPDTREVAVVSGEWAFNVAVAEDSGEVQRTGDGATITLVQAKTAAVSGEGFQPGTRVDIWLFSDPTLLGSVTVASDGSFTGEVYLDSRYAVLGDHTLQLQGVGVDGFIKAANLGVVVAEPATVATDPSSQSLFWIMGAGLIVALAASWALVARRRNRH